MKKVAIVQSNYVPWKGYFDMIAAVDEFILYDDVQYTRRDWRNRNQIKTPHGVQWITVPVKVRGKYGQTIYETEIDGGEWAEKHWKILAQNYGKTPHFNEIAAIFQPLYNDCKYNYLSVLNRDFIIAICRYLGITTKISSSHDFNLIPGKTERLVDLCLQAKATEYISGPAAKLYIDNSIFSQYGIVLSWFDYDGYKRYPQLFGEFQHEVSILDLLFNCGKNATSFMKRVCSLT